MKKSKYKSYDELPLFLNAEMVAKVLGVSPSSGYELMHAPLFPVLKIGDDGACQRKSSASRRRKIRREVVADDKKTLYTSRLTQA